MCLEASHELAHIPTSPFPHRSLGFSSLQSWPLPHSPAGRNAYSHCTDEESEAQAGQETCGGDKGMISREGMKGQLQVSCLLLPDMLFLPQT